MGTPVRNTKTERKAVPQPKNGGTWSRNRPRFSTFEGLGHLDPHAGAQLLRRRRAKQVPAGDFVKEHTEHAPATSDAQTAQAKTILQAAVGRLDPRARRVPLLEHLGRLFHTTSREPTLLVGNVKSERTVIFTLDRTLLPKRARGARRRRHLEPRRCGRRVVRTRRRFVTRGAGIDHPGALVPREVIDRKRLGVRLRRTAGDWADQIHT